MHLGHVAGPARASLWRSSRGRAQGPELRGLETEEAEHVVQPDDLGILPALFRREQASSALLRQFLDARRQILANRIERCLKLFQRPLLHGALLCDRRAASMALIRFPDKPSVSRHP